MRKSYILTALLAVLVWALPARAEVDLSVLKEYTHINNVQEIKDGNCYFLVSDRTKYASNSTTVPKAMSNVQSSYTVNWDGTYVYVYWGDLDVNSEGFLWKAVKMEDGQWAFQNMDNEKYLGNMNAAGNESDVVFSDTPVGYTLTDLTEGAGRFYMTNSESEHSLHVQGYLRSGRPNNSLAKQEVGDDNYDGNGGDDGYAGRWHLYLVKEAAATIVKYVVKDAEGNVLDEAEVETEAGTVVEALPDNMKKPFTTYENGESVTAEDGKTVTFTAVATPDLPFETGTEYVLKIRQTKAVVLNNEGTLVYNANYALKDAVDGQLWTIEGDAYRGLSLKHKATGKYLTPGTPITLTDNSEYLWELCPNFILREKGTELNIIHDYYNQFTYWQNEGALRDGGSMFTAIKPMTIATDLIASLKASNDVGVLYGVTSKEAAAALPDDVSDKSLEEILALVEPVQITLKTGYYRISNDGRNNEVHYARVKTNDKLWADALEEDALADLGSIFRFDVEGSSASVQGQCKYIQPVSTYNNDNIWVKDEPFMIPINKVNGQAKSSFWLTDGQNNNYPNFQYMHQRGTNGYDVCTWNECDASWWVVYPVTTVDVPVQVIGDKAYAALNAPFGFIAPQGVQANTVKLNASGDGAELVPVNGPIPANTPVILVGGAEASKVTLTLTTEASQISGNQLVGTLQAAEIPAGAYVLTDVQGEPKLVPSTEAATLANVAYLPAGLTEAEALPFVEPTATVITSLDEVNENRIYTIKAERGYVAIGERNNGNKTYLVTRSGNGAEESADIQMAFVKVGDNYYLYGVDADTYIPWNYGWGGCRVNSAATGTPAKVTLDGPKLKLNRGYVNLQATNGEYARVNSYSTNDAGNVMTIQEVTGSYFDPTAAKAKVEEALAYYTKQVFTIQGNRGAWTVDVDKNVLAPTHKGSTTTDGVVNYGEELEAINAENPNQQWAFVLNEGNVYLYNVGQKKFLVNNGDVTNLAAHDATPINISWGNSTDPFWLLIDDGTNTINNNNSGSLGFGSWYSPDDGNKVTFTKVADFDDTEAIAQLGIQRYDVTLNLLDENGALITRMVKDYADGDVINSVPAEFKADYYEYDEVTPVTVSEDGDNTVNITAKWVGPFKITNPQMEPNWYFLTIRNYAYAIKGLNETESEIRPYSIEDVLNDQVWSFTGDNINGFSIYNKKVGKYLTGPAQDANSLYSSLSDDATPMWKLIQIEGGKFEINRVGTQRVLNQLGGADIERFQRLGYWVHSTTDAGGHFNVDDPKDMVMDMINEWLEAPDGAVYGLTDTAKEEVKDQIDKLGEEASLASLARVYASIADKEKVQLSTGFYRLINKSYDRALGVKAGGVFNAVAESAEAEADFSTIFKLTLGDNNAVTLSSQALFVPQLATSSQTTGAEEGVTGLVINDGTAPTAAFDFRGEEANNYRCMHIAGAAQGNYQQYDLVGWEAAAPASQWYIVPVEQVEYKLNALGEDEYYASLYLPFTVNVEGADEIDYIYAVANEQAERKIIEGSTIPAGTPVIIKSSSESISLFPSLEAGEPIEGNLLQGTYLDIATPQNGYIFSGVDGELGFYANAREVVPANKAYIVSDEGSPKFLIDFTKTGISSAKANLENAVVYDLQGRRIEKPGKGIYIINGKKVQLK